MVFPKRDLIATGLVAVAGVLYGLWAIESTLPGLSGTRATGIVILALGFAASASAVVPGFDALLHGNKLYVGVTAAMGLVALAGGVSMLAYSSETGLGVLMGAMAALWLIATVHHSMLAGAAQTGGTRDIHGHGPRAAGAH